MLSLKSLVILDEDDKENFDKATDVALNLDRVNFATDGYPVDSKTYPLIRKALFRGKGKATLVDNDEEDVEDIRGLGGTPNLDSKDFIDDVVPLEHGSISHSDMGDDFAQPN